MARPCKPSGNKRSAKMVRGCDGKMKCVKYGYKPMPIKSHIKSRKKSFCARHRCLTSSDPATARYQSCKAWNCTTAKACSRFRTKYRGVSRLRKKRRSSSGKIYKSRSGRKYSKCWSGYRRSGYKMKNGRRVPNCVKK